MSLQKPLMMKQRSGCRAFNKKYCLRHLRMAHFARIQSSSTHEGQISSCSCFHNPTSLRLLKKGKVVFISLYVCNSEKTFNILQSLSLRKLSLSRCSSPEDIESEQKTLQDGIESDLRPTSNF